MLRPPRALGLLALAALLAGCGGGSRPSPTAACTGGDLRGAFTVVPGSAGAGQIVYRLRLSNDSDRSCVLRPPALRLLGAGGKALPTRVIGDPVGTKPFSRLRLAPGITASATARFSPDVPGVGEGTVGRCEPVASRLRVGPLTVAVTPPTSVCEHGRLAFRRLRAG